MLAFKCFVLFIISLDLVVAHSRNNTANSTRIGKHGSKKKLRSIDSEYDDNISLHDSDLLNDRLNGAKDFVVAEQEIMSTRPLHSGDTFTPMEMLPITVKLLSKVEVIGEGKGIVTSSKSPEDLADRLFGAFYNPEGTVAHAVANACTLCMRSPATLALLPVNDHCLFCADGMTDEFLTKKRIVYLNDKDISGLDALQALALEGDVVGRVGMESITESPNTFVRYKGQMVGVDTGPRRCHYKLLNKKYKDSVRVGKDNVRRTERLTLELEKKLQKDRHLIINPGKKNSQSKIGLKKQKTLRQIRHKKGMRLKVNSPGKKEEKKSRRNQNETKYQLTTLRRKKGCKWRYICKEPGDLDSCRLHTSCIDGNDPNAKEDNIYLAHKEDEHKEEIQQFRKMLGITLLDENVEKIIEQHVLEIKPENMRGVDKIETLEEYFNNIMVAQHQRQTTPVDNHDLTQNASENTYKNPAHPMKAEEKSGAEGNMAYSESSDYDGRGEGLRAQEKGNENKTEIVEETGKRILGLPIITSTKARKK